MSKDKKVLLSVFIAAASFVTYANVYAATCEQTCPRVQVSISVINNGVGVLSASDLFSNIDYAGGLSGASAQGDAIYELETIGEYQVRAIPFVGRTPPNLDQYNAYTGTLSGDCSGVITWGEIKICSITYDDAQPTGEAPVVVESTVVVETPPASTTPVVLTVPAPNPPPALVVDPASVQSEALVPQPEETFVETQQPLQIQNSAIEAPKTITPSKPVMETTIVSEERVAEPIVEVQTEQLSVVETQPEQTAVEHSNLLIKFWKAFLSIFAF